MPIALKQIEASVQPSLAGVC